MKTQMIDKSNFDEKQYKADLDSAYECGRASVLSVIEDIKAEIRNLSDLETDNDKVWICDVIEIIDSHISRKENIHGTT